MKNLLFFFGLLFLVCFSSCYATVRAPGPPGPPPVYRHPRWHRHPHETIIIRGQVDQNKKDRLPYHPS